MVQIQNERVEEFNDGKKYQVLKSGPIIDMLQASGVKEPVVVCGDLREIVRPLDPEGFFEVPQICMFDDEDSLTSQTNDRIILIKPLPITPENTVLFAHEVLELDDGNILFTGLNTLGSGKNHVTCGLFADNLDNIVIVKKPHPLDNFDLPGTTHQSYKKQANQALNAMTATMSFFKGSDTPKLLSRSKDQNGDTVLVLKNDYICLNPENDLCKNPTIDINALNSENLLRVSMLQFTQMERWLKEGLVFIDWQDDVKVSYDNSGSLVAGIREVDFEPVPLIEPEFVKKSTEIIQRARLAQALANVDLATKKIIKQCVRQNDTATVPKFDAETYAISCISFSNKLIDYTKKGVNIFHKLDREYLGHQYKDNRELLFLESEEDFRKAAQFLCVIDETSKKAGIISTMETLKDRQKNILASTGITSEEVAQEKKALHQFYDFLSTNNCSVSGLDLTAVNLLCDQSDFILNQHFQKVNELLDTREAKLLGYEPVATSNGMVNIPDLLIKIDNYTLYDDKGHRRDLFPKSKTSQSIKAFYELRLARLSKLSGVPIPKSLVSEVDDQKLDVVLKNIYKYLENVRIELGIEPLVVIEGQDQLEFAQDN